MIEFICSIHGKQDFSRFDIAALVLECGCSVTAIGKELRFRAASIRIERDEFIEKHEQDETEEMTEGLY